MEPWEQCFSKVFIYTGYIQKKPVQDHTLNKVGSMSSEYHSDSLIMSHQPYFFLNQVSTNLYPTRNSSPSTEVRQNMFHQSMERKGKNWNKKDPWHQVSTPGTLLETNQLYNATEK